MQRVGWTGQDGDAPGNVDGLSWIVVRGPVAGMIDGGLQRPRSQDDRRQASQEKSTPLRQADHLRRPGCVHASASAGAGAGAGAVQEEPAGGSSHFFPQATAVLSAEC